MLARITIAALCVACSFAQAEDNSIVQIGGIAAKITKSTSCSRSAWEMNDQNACLCCITKHNYNGDSTQKTFRYCSEKTHCSEESIKIIRERLKLRPGTIDPDEFVKGVVKEAELLPVVTVNEKELAKAGTSGDLDEDTAVYLLKVAANKISINFFKEQLASGETCIHAVKKKATGDTRQLFAIQLESQCMPGSERESAGRLGKTILFLKETTKPIEESMNITRVRADPRLSKYLSNGDSHPTEFALELASNNLVYTYKEQPHFMSLLKSAPGKSVSDLIKAWFRETTDAVGDSRKTIDDVKQITARYQGLFCHAGKALGVFNRDNMVPKNSIFGTTIEHGALSADQYFIGNDPNHEGQYLATMINNQSMAASLKQTKPISGDLLSLSSSAAIAMIDVKTDNREQAKNQWIEVFFEPFIRCYAGVNPPQKLGEVKRELKKIFATSSVWDQLKAQGRSSSEWSDIAKKMIGVIDGLH